MSKKSFRRDYFNNQMQTNRRLSASRPIRYSNCVRTLNQQNPAQRKQFSPFEFSPFTLPTFVIIISAIWQWHIISKNCHWLRWSFCFIVAVNPQVLKVDFCPTTIMAHAIPVPTCPGAIVPTIITSTLPTQERMILTAPTIYITILLSIIWLTRGVCRQATSFIIAAITTIHRSSEISMAFVQRILS